MALSTRSRRPTDHRCSYAEVYSDMHGHVRLVERRIRVWIMQQEFNRRKEEQLIRIGARGGASAERSGRAANLRE